MTQPGHDHSSKSSADRRMKAKARPAISSDNHWLAIGALIGGGLILRRVFAQARATDLHGKVVLIAGSTRGLGLVMAREFARQGCPVAICGRDSEEVSRAQADLMEAEANVFALVCDVSDKAQVDHLTERVTAHFGRIDILVNNAATIQVAPLESTSVEDFQQAMNTIFFGQLNAVMAVLPQMRARHAGQIVNITSIGGRVSVPHLLPYSAAKFAAVGFSEGLRAELADAGISVTTIIPGLMRTGAHVNTLVKGKLQEEFAWFSVSDSLPFISLDARRAAKQIVEATRLRKPQHIITLPAVMLDLLHRLFPDRTVDILGLVDHFLPGGEGGTSQAAWSMDVYRESNPALDPLLRLSNDAALENNEFPGPEPLRDLPTPDI